MTNNVQEPILKVSISWKIYSFIAAITLIIAATIAYALMGANQIILKYTPLVDAAMEIKLETTTGHLWFEEVISGDRQESIEDVWIHFGEAEWYARAMIEGGKSSEGIFIPVSDEQLRRQINTVIRDLKYFQKMAEERLSIKEIGGIGSDIDQRFDDLFSSLMIKIDDVETRLQQVIQEDLTKFRTAQFSLISICFILSIVIGVVFNRFERTRAADFLAVQAARRKAEENEQWLYTTMESMGDGVIITDTNSKVKYINPVTSSMTEWTITDALDMDITDVFNIVNEETGNPAENPVKRVLREKEIVGLANHTVLISKTGTRYPIADSGAPIIDSKGNMIGTVMVFHDITERRQAERERENLISDLEEKNAELERFTYTVSHDLKSPLITITGFLGMLEDDIKNTDEQNIKDDIEQIRNAAKTMKTLLEELLELSRIGRLESLPEDFLLREVGQEAVNILSGSIAEHNIQVNVSQDNTTAFGVRSRFLEVIQNLVDNSIKYMGDQKLPRIEISWKQSNSETVFFVKDNGIGIDPRYHQKVFGLFDQLDQLSEGSGIGLAIVKRVVEVHKGRLWFESEGEGKGSTFYFTIPVKNAT